MTRSTRSIRTMLAAAAIVAGAAGSAAAQTDIVQDPQDAGGAYQDIRWVQAKHATTHVSVTVSFTDLPPESTGGPSSLALYVDTDPGAKGPEYRLATGLEEGSDYQLVRYEDWAPVGDPLSCKHSVVLDHDQAKVYASIARKCLGKPVKVRIGAKMTSNWNPEHPTVDWMKKPRGFTEWLARG